MTDPGESEMAKSADPRRNRGTRVEGMLKGIYYYFIGPKINGMAIKMGWKISHRGLNAHKICVERRDY